VIQLCILLRSKAKRNSGSQITMGRSRASSAAARASPGWTYFAGKMRHDAAIKEKLAEYHQLTIAAGKSIVDQRHRYLFFRALGLPANYRLHHQSLGLCEHFAPGVVTSSGATSSTMPASRARKCSEEKCASAALCPRTRERRAPVGRHDAPPPPKSLAHYSRAT